MAKEFTTNGKQAAIIGTIVAAAAVGIAAFRGYPGAVWPFVVFHSTYLVLLWSIFLRPAYHAYTFFAIFMCLGFWVKALAHFLFPRYGYTGYFLEPVGAFDFTGPSWDRALSYATAAALGVLLARLIFFYTRSDSGVQSRKPANVPVWYVQARATTWIMTSAAVVVLNAVNYSAAFYQVGVNPQLVLPLHLNVLVAWLINIGFAQWIAALVWWEHCIKSRRSAVALMAPLVEGVIATMSTLSRSVGFLHLVPYLFSLSELYGLRQVFKTRKRMAMTAGLFLLFVSVIVTVQVLRAKMYYGNPDVKIQFTRQAPAGEPEAQTEARYAQHVREAMISQLPLLVTQRWIGLEAVLAMSSHPQIGLDLFSRALVESPKQGQNSLYQKIAGSRYEKSAGFTFLTLAGVVGILACAGSLVVVAAGMFAVTMTLIYVDVLSRNLTGNPFLVAVTGMAIANVLCQMNYAYLTMIFFVQMLLVLGFIALLQRPKYCLALRA